MALQRALGASGVAVVDFGASRNPPKNPPYRKMGGGGRGRRSGVIFPRAYSVITVCGSRSPIHCLAFYGNVARAFALRLAVCWVITGFGPAVSNTVITLIKAVKAVVL